MSLATLAAAREEEEEEVAIGFVIDPSGDGGVALVDAMGDGVHCLKGVNQGVDVEAHLVLVGIVGKGVKVGVGGGHGMHAMPMEETVSDQVVTEGSGILQKKLLNSMTSINICLYVKFIFAYI